MNRDKSKYKIIPQNVTEYKMSFTKEAVFTQARSHKIFFEDKVSQEAFVALYEIAKWSPSANNSCPLRYVFVSEPEGLEILKEAAMGGNKEKAKSANAAVILAYDIRFYAHFSKLAPYMPEPAPQASWSEEELEKEAIKSAGIQAGFFMAAARAEGWDCGPMAGFDGDLLAKHFFPKDSWKYYFVILLGHGDSKQLYPRGQRLSLEEACILR